MAQLQRGTGCARRGGVVWKTGSRVTGLLLYLKDFGAEGARRNITSKRVFGSTGGASTMCPTE